MAKRAKREQVQPTAGMLDRLLAIGAGGIPRLAARSTTALPYITVKLAAEHYFKNPDLTIADLDEWCALSESDRETVRRAMAQLAEGLKAADG